MGTKSTPLRFLHMKIEAVWAKIGAVWTFVHAVPLFAYDFRPRRSDVRMYLMLRLFVPL